MQLVSWSPTVSKNILDFESTKDSAAVSFREEQLSRLLQCSASFSAGPNSTQMEPTRGAVLADHNAAIQDLYTTLNEYCLCEGTRIGLRMRLKIDQTNDGAIPIFTIQFVIHPHLHSNMREESQDWQIVTMTPVLE